jgi:hypothetical protein
MLKNIFFIFFISINYTVYSQQVDKKFFSQGIIQIEDKNSILELEKKIRNNKDLSVVRLDPTSKQFFIITNSSIELNESILKQMFLENGKDLKCINIGVYGVDEILTFPFKNCN